MGSTPEVVFQNSICTGVEKGVTCAHNVHSSVVVIVNHNLICTSVSRVGG